MTQNIPAVKTCVWTVCIWRTKTFKKVFEEKGHAVFSGKVGLYTFDKFKSVKISTEEDFALAELLLQYEHKWRIPSVPYDSQQTGKDYPAMWLSEIHYIENLLLELARNNEPIHALEWGSGQSTIHFPKFLKEHNVNFSWSAVENYIPWFQKVESMIKEAGLSETTRCYLQSATCEERKKIQEQLDLSEFLNFPAQLGKKFHFILVDARRRNECLKKAAEISAPGGVVVLHDAERSENHDVLDLYENRGEMVVENKSPVPGGTQKLWVGRVKENSLIGN